MTVITIAPDTTHDWTADGLCLGGDPELLFARGAAQNVAKVMCRACPVRLQCLADALDHQVEYGVWGGMTERERRALLRRRPDVDSWRRMFDDAKEAALLQQR